MLTCVMFGSRNRTPADRTFRLGEDPSGFLFERPPRFQQPCFSETALVTQERCTAGRDNHSDIDHTWSVNPAAIAGLRFTRRPSSSSEASVRTGQQKL